MKNLQIIFLVLSFCFALSSKVKAQVVINEFVASNSSGIVDPDFNENADWIELHNPTSSAINIGGYFLTDKLADSIKWQFPQNTVIKPFGFLIIWADGYDTGLHANFKLSAEGEEIGLFNTTGQLVDSISFGLQEANVSMGLEPATSKRVFFSTPTPGAANSSTAYFGIVRNKPQFQTHGGIFSENINVEIKNTFGGNVRYTLNGAEPTAASPIYTAPFTISKTTIVRARIFKSGQIAGPVVTQTYFVDKENMLGNLPIFSISSDPANFWDSQKGIYVQDFKPEWEIPVNIELFENDGSDRAAFNTRAGVKINGLYSWQLPQKMLGIYFRKEYGEGKLDYPLFFDKEQHLFDTFSLRASGSDWSYTLFRDAMIQFLTHENMNVDYQSYRPAIAFFNGEYMGIHNIRMKVDGDFIQQNHNLVDVPIEMIANEDLAEIGNLDNYLEFKRLYQNDLSDQANFNKVTELMDIENFTDFIITEIYSRNTSVDHNIMCWKPVEGGKWKWILMDLDRGFFSPTSTLINYYEQRSVIPFEQLMDNESYRHYFGRRLADHLFTTFNPEQVKEIIGQFAARIENEVPKHIERWEGTTSSYGDAIPSFEYWRQQVELLKSFANLRPAALLSDLMNYGFNESADLEVHLIPNNAGKFEFNGLKSDLGNSLGKYPIGEGLVLRALPNDGYRFMGWKQNETIALIKSEETWQYYDESYQLDNNWKNINFNTSAWKTGKAEFGYGDDDENTVINYGTSQSRKNITVYFRKAFTINDLSFLGNFKLHLKCDDGAVVYINGHEVLRQNMPSGLINYTTLANSSVSGSAEEAFTSYTILTTYFQKGENCIAVEVHQNSASSSDLSFDLSLTAIDAGKGTLLTNNLEYRFTHNNPISVCAVFEPDGTCVLANQIATELTLSKECSPVMVPQNVVIEPTGKLIIEAGVKLYMADGVSLNVNGSLIVKGEKSNPVLFTSNPNAVDKKWGVISIVNAVDTSYLEHLIIENASVGKHPIRENAAISSFNSSLKINYATIENVYANPISARYSNVELKNSKLHSKITGDLVNFKYGNGIIDSCEFVGNNMPDTDAIDYDDVTNGIISNSKISDFNGFNSDAIDIGEQAKDVVIQNVIVRDITDKGVSVGQQSKVEIHNSIFVNCNLGAGLKDSSYVVINGCTYYGTGTAIAVFEKNPGDAGANVFVSNTILSNAYNESWSADSRSTIVFNHSLSDNDSLPNGTGNLFGNPLFVNPNMLNFELQSNSPCIGRGSSGNMGSNLTTDLVPQLYISGIYYRTDLESSDLEFVVITNPSTVEVDLSGYKVTKGVEMEFPQGTRLGAGRSVFITNNPVDDFWQKKTNLIQQWQGGRLADEGEAIQLETPTGIVVDKVRYNNKAPWPLPDMGQGIQLVFENLDNHFGENWKSISYPNMVGVGTLSKSQNKLYPNPTYGQVYFIGLKSQNYQVDVYNLTGVKVASYLVNPTSPSINLQQLQQGVYLLHYNGFAERIMLLK